VLPSSLLSPYTPYPPLCFLFLLILSLYPGCAGAKKKKKASTSKPGIEPQKKKNNNNGQQQFVTSKNLRGHITSVSLLER